MQNVTRDAPAYFLRSVDNALQLAQMLRDEGELRVADAAQRLGVAPSTAHRILGMLLYRGFAVQDGARRYLPGPALGARVLRVNQSRRLRESAEPHLVQLRDGLGESTNLVVRAGSSVRFLLTVESRKALRVGDRQGAILPARRASGGKAILACLEPAQVARLYAEPDIVSTAPLTLVELHELAAELQRVRARGYAVNASETEQGVCAVGVALRTDQGTPIGAISVAAPENRFPSITTPAAIGLILSTRAAIEGDLQAGRSEAPAGTGAR